MTPERWCQIDDLFAASLRLEPRERRNWLRQVCGDDEELRAEVDRLLNQDEQATQAGFLAPPRLKSRPFDLTPTYTPQRTDDSPAIFSPIEPKGELVLDNTGGFTPKAVIAAAPDGSNQVAENRSMIQARLKELAIIYVVLFGITLFWRQVVLGFERSDLMVLGFTVFVIGIIASIAMILSGKRSFTLARLEAFELIMIGLLGAMEAFGQYRLMLADSLREDRMMAQLVMKNIVLLTCILILSYGLYVPKNWRRVACVAALLALLPFVTLAVLCLQNPEAMVWLERGWSKSQTARLWVFSFDAMILAIVAIGATLGARTISRLRRQVVEARQLGQYRLLEHIGAGGMGEVYLAEHYLLKRPCALKLIRPSAVADPNVLERFEREVQLTATLSHPNTVEIYDYGRTEDGTYYYVMEYLPGLSLAELVDRYGALTPARAVYLLRQVCLALREAHAAGLIHRDVKPSNIFAARRGGMDDVAKLLDFGLVRPAITTRDAHLSGEGQILGTPLFMSPEQSRGGRELDERSDIYSLGAVAYYLLTGRPPFDEDDGIGVIIALARDPVIPPSHICAAVPADLERVVLKCLHKDPSSRFPDAGSLERALSECACVIDWDQTRAAQWWRQLNLIPAVQTAQA